MLLQYHNRMGMPLYYSPYTRTSSWGHQDVLANFTEEMQMGASLRSYNTSTTESDDEGAMCIVTDDTNNEEDIISVDDDGCENLICKWDDCERHFDSPDNLAQHVTTLHATTTRGGQYFCCWKDCPRSDRGFNARYKMLVHVRTHTKEKPHKCSICDKRFSRAENLKIHLRSHSGERPYVCPVLGCNKAYSNSSDRFKHTKTHSTDRPYFCKIPGCNKRYTDPSSLRKHVKTFKHHTLSVEPVVKAQQQQQQQQEIRLQPDVVDTTKKCTCSHECFEHLQKAEIFKLGHLLNKSNWGKLWDPEDFIKNNINHVENVNVDMDVPLDLSIHK